MHRLRGRSRRGQSRRVSSSRRMSAAGNMKRKASTKRSASKPRVPSVPDADLPLYCDFTCTFASFPPPDASGACRREEAVYCRLLREFNRKHAGCMVRKVKQKRSTGD